MKESQGNEVIRLLNKRRSLKDDLLQMERTEWYEGIDILFQSTSLELTEDEFNFVKDTYITKLNALIKEIDAELNIYGITMENE